MLGWPEDDAQAGAADPVTCEDPSGADEGQPLVGVEAGPDLETADEPGIDRYRRYDLAENTTISADDSHRSGGGTRRRPADAQPRSGTDLNVRMPANDARKLTTVARCQRALNAPPAGECGRGELGAVELLAVRGERRANACLQHGVDATRLAALRQGAKPLESGNKRKKCDQRKVGSKPDFETPHRYLLKHYA